ncbi:MAG: hypothetical protein QXU32_05460 [Nitrososphaerales archaeon]
MLSIVAELKRFIHIDLTATDSGIDALACNDLDLIIANIWESGN